MRRIVSPVLLLLAVAATPLGAQTFTCAANGDATCTDLIPDANGATPGVLRSVITVPAGACSLLLGATVDVAITHDFVGDLRLRLIAPDGTARVLLDRSGLAALPPGGCGSDDVAVTFADGGAAAACPITIPTLSGTQAPVEPLAALAGGGGTGAWTLEITDAVHAGTGALDAWAVNLTCRSETCDNCIDDDGDGAVDRADPDCPPPANGGGAGLGDQRGKSAVTCQKAIQKAGGALVARRMARVQKCFEGLLGCVQRKPGDAGCLGKANAKCTRELGRLAGDGGKLAGAVTKRCGNAEDLLGATGLGYGAEAGICAARGVGSLASPGDVASCVRAVHECHADALVGLQAPRATELLGGAAAQLPCLGGGAGSGAGVGDAGRGKATLKCSAAIRKASAQFVAKKTKLLQQCATAVGTCVQRNDAACVARAGGRCGRQIGKIGGLESRLRSAITRGCPAGVQADMLADVGLGFTSLGEACAAAGGSAGSVGDVAACLTRYHECRVDQLVESQSPRLRELVGLAGAALP